MPCGNNRLPKIVLFNFLLSDARQIGAIAMHIANAYLGAIRN